MKKILLITLLCAGFRTASNAQNSLQVSVTSDLCLNKLSLVYNDNTVHDFDLGCAGDYLLDIGNNGITAILINGVSCALHGTTHITVNGNKSAYAVFDGEAFEDNYNVLKNAFGQIRY